MMDFKANVIKIIRNKKEPIHLYYIAIYKVIIDKSGTD